MRLSRLTLLAPLALASLLGACSKGLTEQSARSVVEAAEDAFKRGDFDALPAFHSDDCMTHDRVPDKNGVMHDVNKACGVVIEDGRKLITTVKGNGGSYTYTSTVTGVEVAGGKATAHLHVSDVLSGNGHSMESEGDQTETVELRNGKVLITKIDTKTTSLIVDGRQQL